MKDAYLREVDDVLGDLKTDLSTGLSSSEAERRLEEYGPNKLPEPEPTSFLTLVINQFKDLLVLILLGAAVVSFLLALFEDSEDQLTAFVEPAVILLILIANAAVGVIQETNAEASIAALKQSEARVAHVIRDGAQTQVESVDLVPGDVILVDVGDKVPADARLVDILTATLSVDEAMLTGESVASSKSVEAQSNRDAVDAEKHNMIFSGTLVVRGKAMGVVTDTGAGTSMGAIAQSLSENDDEEKTPLQEKLDEFGEQLSKVILVICIVVWVINIGHFTDEEHGSLVGGAIYYFKIAVALAVAAIPEGLPAVVTTCLALGTMKMARKNAIVRTLPSVETLGCTTVICSDKTGTLTTNKMSVQHVLTVRAAGREGGAFDEFSVKGDSFSPFGEVLADGERRLALPAVEAPSLAEVSKICALCNESDLQYAPDGTDKQDSTAAFTKSGTPTEAALKVLAEKLGVDEEGECDRIFRSRDPRERVRAAADFWASQFERRHLLEFNRQRKSMSVCVRDVESGDSFLFAKGAPENIISRCSHVRTADGVVPLSEPVRHQLMESNLQLASKGLRCLALASVHNPTEDRDWADMSHYADIESDMTFEGLVSMRDPPRAGVDKSIAKCYAAGIRVIVITGDFQATAESICRQIGVFDVDEDVSGKSFTGAQFSAMSEARQLEVVRKANLFSRVEPKHKQRLVELLKRDGEVVAMTGDGVNDAPALKSAHIGVAMGSGTDVAREASDMVLQDDNFSTIVMAVEEGRAIYANTKQFIRYLISSNIGEVACIFMTAAIGMPEALIPVQLLWVNLVTDGLPATALGFNPPDADIMSQPPRSRKEGIINGWMFFRYMAIGIYVGIGTVASFIHWYTAFEGGANITYEQLTSFSRCGHESGGVFGPDFDCTIFHDARPSTIALSVLVTIEMFNALNALSENQSLLVTPPWSNIWVILAMILSFALHFVILYVPWFNSIFHVAPISLEEWNIVLAWSFPVFILDEILKFISRNVEARSGSSKRKAD